VANGRFQERVELVSWCVKFESDRAGTSITVKAGGFISGEVDAATWKGNVQYPSYSYIDEIGGEVRREL